MAVTARSPGPGTSSSASRRSPSTSRWRNASTRAGCRRSARPSGTSRTSSSWPGEAVRNRRRSATMIASCSEWVTNSAVAPCRSSRSSSRRRSRWAVGSSSETKGSSSRSRLGSDHERPGQGGAARHAERQARGVDVDARRRARPRPARRRSAGPGPGRRAGRGADCPRRCARGAGAAPGRRRPSRRRGRARAGPRSPVTRPATMLSSVVLPQPDGPMIASRSPGATSSRTLARASLAAAPPTAGKHCSRRSRLSAAIGPHDARSAAACPTRSAGRRR